jgi:hypothetical protein
LSKFVLVLVEKEKAVNSTRPKATQAAQPAQEQGRAHAADFARRSLVFWLTQSWFFYCCPESLTVSKKTPRFYSLPSRGPRRCTAQGGKLRGARLAVGSQDRCSRVADTESDPPAHFPQHNFTKGYLVCSGRSDRRPCGQLNAFPAIGGGLVQSDGLTSITGM